MTADMPLDQVAAQRAALAKRAGAPWWYVVLAVLATVAVPASQWAATRVSEGLGLAMLVAAIVVFLGCDPVVRRTRGVALSTSPAAYPSAIAPAIVLAVVMLVGLLAVRMTGNAGAGPVAMLIVTAAFALVSVAVFLWTQAAIRRDIVTGRARVR